MDLAQRLAAVGSCLVWERRRGSGLPEKVREVVAELISRSACRGRGKWVWGGCVFSEAVSLNCTPCSLRVWASWRAGGGGGERWKG